MFCRRALGSRTHLAWDLYSRKFLGVWLRELSACAHWWSLPGRFQLRRPVHCFSLSPRCPFTARRFTDVLRITMPLGRRQLLQTTPFKERGTSCDRSLGQIHRQRPPCAKGTARTSRFSSRTLPLSISSNEPIPRPWRHTAPFWPLDLTTQNKTLALM